MALERNVLHDVASTSVFVAICGCCACVLQGCGRGNFTETFADPFSATAGLAGGFYVAEVKPHYQCKGAGQDRVRTHVGGLVSKGYGILALIQFEFTLPQPKGYLAFGASCTTKYCDPVVVLVNENLFSLVSGIGETLVGDYNTMPFLQTGNQTSGAMCVADPMSAGQRGYAGAVLREKSSGIEFCMISGTFPHTGASWLPQVLQNLEDSCGGRRLLIVADTNTNWHESMEAFGKRHAANWGKCSDPATANPEPTCCHDLSKPHSEAQYWFDRTALCGGGVVDQLQVNRDYVCGTNQEHKFTSAVVHLDAADAPEQEIPV